MAPTLQIAAIVFTLATLVSGAAVAPRDSFQRVSLKKVVGENITLKALTQHGHARAKSFSKHSAAAVGSVSVINQLVSYIAYTTVGKQTFELIVDTVRSSMMGSSNTWVGANTKYKKSSTGTSLGKTVSVTYGSGSFSGKEYTDKVTLGGVTVNKQSIGVASSSSGFSGIDGILGVGPVGLTQGTVSGTSSVPTFLDNLYSQGTISNEVLGVYFAPESGSDQNDENGVLTLGGIDSSRYTGSLKYVPTLTAGDFAHYWGVTVDSIRYGSTSLLGSNGAIVDTVRSYLLGTTLIDVPTSAYNAFLRATGGTTDIIQGLPVFSKKPTGNLTFTIGGVAYTLTPAQYLIPAAEYVLFGLDSDKYYAWISDGGSTSVDFIIGQKFLENYYSVYDTTNSRVGFATRA